MNVCDVTLCVYPHRASLKNMPDYGGNRTYDLWNISPMLCQLSYAVRSVLVCDISELSLVPSISMQSNNHDFSCVGVMYSGEYDVCDVTLSVYPHQASSKICLTTVGIEPTTFGILAQCSANVVRHIFQACPVWIYTTSYSPEYITPTQKKKK